jgi:transcriptional regulator with XRE-family HTH domain
MDKISINNRFSEAIEYLINHGNGISKGDIAELLDLKSSTFSEILKGRMNVATDHIAKLIVSYDISPEWLLTGNGPMLKRDLKRDSGYGDSENKDLTRELIKEIGDLRQQLGEQINENTHLQAEIDELKKKVQNKSTQRHSVYSPSDIAAEPEE